MPAVWGKVAHLLKKMIKVTLLSGQSASEGISENYFLPRKRGSRIAQENLQLKVSTWDRQTN